MAESLPTPRSVQVRASRFTDKGRETDSRVWIKLEEGSSGDVYLTVRPSSGENAILRALLKGEDWRKLISPSLDRVYQIQSHDVGRHFLKAFGTTWPLADLTTTIAPADIGKLVYRVTLPDNRDILQFESDWMRRERERLVSKMGQAASSDCGYVARNNRICPIPRHRHDPAIIGHDFEPRLLPGT